MVMVAHLVNMSSNRSYFHPRLTGNSEVPIVFDMGTPSHDTRFNWLSVDHDWITTIG